MLQRESVIKRRTIMRFEDKVVVITGGGSGIGEATALAFAREGARVVVSDVDLPRAKRVVQSIDEKGEAIAVQCDVTKAAHCKRLVKRASDAYGRIDIVFANAGIVGKGGTVTEYAEDDWDREWAIHVKGVYLTCKFAIPEMKKGGGGAIVVTSSGGAIQMGKRAAVYCAAKAAAATLARQMALDYALDSIRVNAVLPGCIRTPLYDVLEEKQKDPEGFFGRLSTRPPVQRIGEPEEVAQAVLFLADGAAASFVTGVCLLVDGGQTLWLGI